MFTKRTSMDNASSSTETLPSSSESSYEYTFDTSTNIKQGCMIVKSQHESMSYQGVKKGPNKKNIKFAQIEIREYSQVLGDHPCVSSGAPIALDWDYSETPQHCIDLETYESRRGPRRTKYELRVPPLVRELLLIDVGYSMRQIHASIQQCQEDKKSIMDSSRDNDNIFRRLRAKRTSLRKQKLSFRSQRRPVSASA